jgi:hypothetical protein
MAITIDHLNNYNRRCQVTLLRSRSNTVEKNEKPEMPVAPTTRAAATRSLDAAPPPCSTARSHDGAPPSACAARLRGPDAAPPAARHGEGEPLEPPRGHGEPSGVNGGRGTVRGCRW